ncbi:hypothetical protein C3486_28660 [Streptomyces sp. Ru73]|uniref:hypothetical protein n=1 Tax=Streptomyces sp. Ru73 TaxID=2080748 RepID=UPI000CDCFFA1|nr:hypothetical protein [Streptomyces sp. Ru73]POX37386.1 hypothetical protein C3486_28660 [Streptomyces sp. Ru73]
MYRQLVVAKQDADVIQGETVSFEDEWAGLRSRSTAAGTHTQINSTGPLTPGGNNGLLLPPGGSTPLASSPAKKKAAAEALDKDVVPDTKKAGGHADEATTKAQKAFDGWETGKGLKSLMTDWEKSVKTLQGRLSRERQALTSTNNTLQDGDHAAYNGLQQCTPENPSGKPQQPPLLQQQGPPYLSPKSQISGL